MAGPVSPPGAQSKGTGWSEDLEGYLRDPQHRGEALIYHCTWDGNLEEMTLELTSDYEGVTAEAQESRGRHRGIPRAMWWELEFYFKFRGRPWVCFRQRSAVSQSLHGGRVWDQAGPGEQESKEGERPGPGRLVGDREPQPEEGVLWMRTLELTGETWGQRTGDSMA